MQCNDFESTYVHVWNVHVCRNYQTVETGLCLSICRHLISVYYVTCKWPWVSLHLMKLIERVNITQKSNCALLVYGSNHCILRHLFDQVYRPKVLVAATSYHLPSHQANNSWKSHRQLLYPLELIFVVYGWCWMTGCLYIHHKYSLCFKGGSSV